MDFTTDVYDCSLSLTVSYECVRLHVSTPRGKGFFAILSVVTSAVRRHMAVHWLLLFLHSL